MEAFFMQVFSGKFYLKVYLGTTGIFIQGKKIYWLVCSQLSYQKSLAQKGFAELRAISFIISPRRQGHLSKFCWIELWQEMQIDITAQKTSTSSCHGVLLLSNLTFYCHQGEISLALPDSISVLNGRFLFPELMSPETCQWPQAEHGPSCISTTPNFDRNCGFLRGKKGTFLWEVSL